MCKLLRTGPLLTCTQMSEELDVFVGNTTIMDEEVYQLWLDGYTGMLGMAQFIRRDFYVINTD